jgi:hypothetical protein
MQYRTFGKTGIKVSPYALGAMMFGAVGNPDHDDSVRIIHKALDAGINFIDTADAYSRGESEAIVGKAIAGRRDSVLSDDVLGQLDAIVPPGTDVGRLDMAYNPPAIVNPALRRREATSRSAI